MKFRAVLAVFATVLVTFPSVAAAAEKTDVVRVVVSFDGATTSTSVLDAAVGAVEVDYVGAVAPRTRVYELTGAVTGGVSEEISALEEIAGVREVVLDTAVTISAANGGAAVASAFYDDPFYENQWYLDSTNGIRAPQAWQFTEGAGVRVAVVDTGHTSHPDLDANIVNGYDFVTDSVSANDGDGRDADARDPGDACTASSLSSWHGTHVSGIIAADSGNGVGVSGVAPKSKVLSVRALGKCGGTMTDVVAGMRWAAGLSVPGVPANPNPAKVINLSLSGAGACATWVQSAVNEVVAAGALVVVAAGNDNTNASERTPANCNNVITVAATSLSGGRASFSNYGAVVDIAAPGVSILNTLNDGAAGPDSPSYEWYSGTSMATPQVAGVAALLLSLQPGLSVSDLRTRLLGTARAFPATCSMCGAGLLDAGAAMAVGAAVELPGEPRNFTAEQVGESVRLRWDAPTSSGSSAVSGYVVTGGNGCDTSLTTCTVSGLLAGELATFTVRARNAKGLGASATRALTFIGVPGAPNGPVVSIDGLSAVLLWQAPGFDGGSAVTGYVVTGSPDGGCTTAETTCTITGLQPGATYSFSIAAVNAAGPGAPAVSGGHQTAAGPATPVAGAVSFGETSGLVSWEPGAGGLAAESFKVTVSPGGATCETTGSRCAVSGLTPGTSYSVSVVAIGPVGTQSPPSVLSATTAGVAPTPTTTPQPPVAPSVPSAPTTTPAEPGVTPPSSTAPADNQSGSLTVKKGSRTALTKLVTVGKAKVTWRTSGGCRIAGKVLVAPKKNTTCRVVGSFKVAGKTKRVSRTVLVR